MSEQELKKMSTKAKITFWTTFIIGGFICLSMPWWTFIILGVVLFIEYAVAVAPDDEPAAAAEEKSAESGKQQESPEAEPQEEPQDELKEEDESQEEETQEELEEEEETQEEETQDELEEEEEPQEEEPQDELEEEDESQEEETQEELEEEEDDSASTRYEIYIKEIDKNVDVDSLNKIYGNLTKIDPYRYPEIEDVAGKRKFPKLPLILFDNLTLSQCKLLVSYLPTFFGPLTGGSMKITWQESSNVFPDKIKIKIGTLFCSDTIEFVKVTGYKYKSVDVTEDYWVATKPLTNRNIDLMMAIGSEINRKSKEFFLSNAFYRGSTVRHCFGNYSGIRYMSDAKNLLEEKIIRNLPSGFRIGLLPQYKFAYALCGGQHGSPYKHPGTDNAETFKKDTTVNALGMSGLAGPIICFGKQGRSENSPYRYVFYDTKSCSVKENEGANEDYCVFKTWFGIRAHASIMNAAVHFAVEQRKQQEIEQEREQREQREREKKQEAIDAAVLRRQKLLRKKKEEQEQ